LGADHALLKYQAPPLATVHRILQEASAPILKADANAQMTGEGLARRPDRWLDGLQMIYYVIIPTKRVII
jgi:hypothetical protein